MLICILVQVNLQLSIVNCQQPTTMGKAEFIACVYIIYIVIIVIDAFLRSPIMNWPKYSDIKTIDIHNTIRKNVIENKDSFYENHYGGWNTTNIIKQNVSVQIKITTQHYKIGTKNFIDNCLTKECVYFYTTTTKIDVFVTTVYDSMFSIHDEYRLYEVEPSNDNIVNHRNRYIFIGLAPFVGSLGLVLTYGFLCCLGWTCKETFKSIEYKIENSVNRKSKDIIFNNNIVKNNTEVGVAVV